MEKTRWTDRVKNDAVMYGVKEDRMCYIHYREGRLVAFLIFCVGTASKTCY